MTPQPVPERMRELPGDGSGNNGNNGDRNRGDYYYDHYYDYDDYCYCHGYPWSCYLWGWYWYPCYGYYGFYYSSYWPSYPYYPNYWDYNGYGTSSVVYISYPNYVNYVPSQDETTDYYAEQEPVNESPPPPLAAGTKELMDRGMELFKQGLYIEAFSMFSRATLADLNAPVAKFVYAHTLFALGLYADAAKEILSGLALMPEWPEVGGDLKQLYGEIKDFDAQMAALKAHLKVRGEDEDALLVLAYTSYFTGDLYAAEKAFEKLALSSRPETASAAGLFQAVIQKIKAADH